MPRVQLRSAEREVRGLRDRLVVNYSPLVRYVAGRTAERISGLLDQEGLISSGLIELLGAVETFDPGRRAKFESYAISKRSVVHPRRAEEGRLPLAPHASQAAPDRPRLGRAGAEAR